MNNRKSETNFTSYIGSEALDKNNGNKNGSVQELKPRLLNGEIVTGTAHNVILLSPLSDREAGAMGSLFITNYKLTFVPIHPATDKVACQRNNLLGEHDISLGNVGALWLTDASLARKQRLMPYSSPPNKLKGLQIVCKNMKVVTFSFRNSPLGQGRTVALALLHHAFPQRHDLLFAYDYRESYYPTLDPHLNMFQQPTDWKRELERCGCPGWRISCINGTPDAFMSTAGKTLIVPNSALDFKLVEAARHQRGGRVPVWVWGRGEGAALLRSGELLPTEHAATHESVLLEQVRRSHPRQTAPQVVSLRGAAGGYLPPAPAAAPLPALPPLPALDASWRKLADLCTPPTLHAFWERDSQFYSALESSRWLSHVSAALTLADEVARRLLDNVSVVLQEGEGVDYCCVVSSLAQLLLDPHARSVAGFQSLVQKEWVAMGHPFCDRLGVLCSRDREGAGGEPAAAPVFLLFLDCAWQLTRQHPAAFQYTQTYLTTLWDCVHNHAFDTFLFNCPRDRELAVDKNLVQRPVWDWGEQFSEQDIALFYNPLYTPQPSKNPNRQSTVKRRSTAPAQLSVSAGVSSLELWSQCYERWLSPLDTCGGPAHYHLFNRALLAEIQKLKEKLASEVSVRQSAGGQSNGLTSERVKRQVVSRFYPFSRSKHAAHLPTQDIMQASLIDASDLLDSLSLLNAPD